jgi:uncharacterized phage infection (PIP) family protein YhgE
MKNLFKTALAAFMEQVAKLAQAVLPDGAVLEAEAFEVGQAIFIVEGENRVPAPAGEYPIEEVGLVVVDDNGQISEVRAVEAEESEEAEAMPEEMKAAFAKFSEEVAELKAIRKSQDERIAKLEAAFAEKEEGQTKLAEAMTKLSEDLSKVTVRTAIAPPKKAEPQEFKFSQAPDIKTRLMEEISQLNLKPTN